jgi:hypothetical protein
MINDHKLFYSFVVIIGSNLEKATDSVVCNAFLAELIKPDI